MSEFPEILYVVNQEKNYPGFGKQLVGSEYLEGTVPANNIPTAVAVYKLDRIDAYKRTVKTETTLEKL